MESELPEENCATAEPTPTPSHSKRPSQPLYVPKQRLQSSKDKEKTQTQEGVKPRPRPRYTDKARKNAKNKKHKAGGEEKAASAGGEDGSEMQEGDKKPDVDGQRLQDAGVQENGHSDSVDADAVARLEAVSLQDEQEEEGESWDTMFNDDGDCLDPHLLEEVRARRWSN